MGTTTRHICAQGSSCSRCREQRAVVAKEDAEEKYEGVRKRLAKACEDLDMVLDDIIQIRAELCTEMENK